ncbi:hypothetical protein QJS10_CPA10g00819 [Acorus calamus]|uniref:Ubiquitin-like domain-containing protein n=1 Tax=Acorus calamus TaxID=4465 RepID=A0AAV9DWS2_ACOCL|nr:hypothetical protein QJS10_CPA10g00819 [Acorus calamus]
MISVTVHNKTRPGCPPKTLTGDFNTVAALKREVERVCGVLDPDQLLVHDRRLMRDASARLSDYGVADGASVHLHHRLRTHKQVRVTVQRHHDGHVQLVNADTQWSIGELKLAIDARVGVPPRRQRLAYMEAELRDEDTVRDYVIDVTPTLEMMELPREKERSFVVDVVNVVTEEFEIMRVEERDTVNTVCAEMRRRGLNKGNRFYLKFGGRKLEGQSSLDDNNIENGDSIHMLYNM